MPFAAAHFSDDHFSEDQTFPDVPVAHENFAAIEYGAHQGIVSGYTDGSYRPDRPITRSEFLKILFVADRDLTTEELEGCYLPDYVFSDVPIDAWFQHYVCMAYRENVVEGYQDGTFRPGQNITAAEALKIVSLQFLPEAIPKLLDSGPWYESYTQAVADKNALPLSIVSPGHEITRGEMMEIVWRLDTKNTALPSHSYESFAGVAEESSEFRQTFLNDNLKTNTALADIDINQVLDGGPGKDGIPALSDPKFISPSRTSWLNDDSLGILYQGENETRFYPYDVLYWHEIVNDSLDGKNIAVTFCPLCGSAIVYDRNIGGDTYSFGVSGKLWQSNLLMYDKETETLWSQIEGRAVIGDLIEKKLEVLPSDLLTFQEAKLVSQNLKVLSKDTGYDREYGVNPYGTYETNASIFFPIQNLDERFDRKELFIATVYEGESVAFHRLDLLSETRANISVNGKTLFARTLDDKTIEVYDLQGNVYPHYTAMWFSWANHNNGFVWNKD